MRKPLEKELKSYREQGISLYLNGILSNPKTIAKACQIAEGVDTCVITLKMKNDGSLVWILISSKKNNKRESCPNRF